MCIHSVKYVEHGITKWPFNEWPMALATAQRISGGRGKHGQAKYTYGDGLQASDLGESVKPDDDDVEDMDDVVCAWPLTELSSKKFKTIVHILQENNLPFTCYSDAQVIDYTPNEGFQQLGEYSGNNKYARHWTQVNAFISHKLGKQYELPLHIPTKTEEDDDDEDDNDQEITTMSTDKTKKKNKNQINVDENMQRERSITVESQVSTSVMSRGSDDQDDYGSEESDSNEKGVLISQRTLQSAVPIRTLANGDSIYLVNFEQKSDTEIVIPNVYQNIAQCVDDYSISESLFRSLDELPVQVLRYLRNDKMLSAMNAVFQARNEFDSGGRKWLWRNCDYSKRCNKLYLSIVQSVHNVRVDDSRSTSELRAMERVLIAMVRELSDQIENESDASKKNLLQLKQSTYDILLKQFRLWSVCPLVHELWWLKVFTADQVEWYIYLLNSGVEALLDTYQYGVWLNDSRRTNSDKLLDILTVLSWVSKYFKPLLYALLSKLEKEKSSRGLSVSVSNEIDDKKIEAVQKWLVFWNDVNIQFQTVQRLRYTFGWNDIAIHDYTQPLLTSFVKNIVYNPHDVLKLLQTLAASIHYCDVGAFLGIAFGQVRFIKFNWFRRIINGPENGPCDINNAKNIILFDDVASVDKNYMSVRTFFTTFFEISNGAPSNTFALDITKGDTYHQSEFQCCLCLHTYIYVNDSVWCLFLYVFLIQ